MLYNQQLGNFSKLRLASKRARSTIENEKLISTHKRHFKMYNSRAAHKHVGPSLSGKFTDILLWSYEIARST